MTILPALHLMSFDRTNYPFILHTLGPVSGHRARVYLTDEQVHACCLMSNHYHLVLETPDGDSEGQRSRAAAIRGGDGIAAGGGTIGAMETGSAGLVFGRGAIP
jgi:hypothetical protein